MDELRDDNFIFSFQGIILFYIQQVLSTHNTIKGELSRKIYCGIRWTLEIVRPIYGNSYGIGRLTPAWSAKRAFQNRGHTRYRRVEVLLLRWEEDELPVEWELNDLAKVFRDYKFNTETWLIPTESPYMKTMAC